ncbi:MAG: hypothetical protein FWD87_07825 [Spirochaetaceae bacterium]|nr:hypothetical protein [Spirochaetaceae bacterium]
MLRYLASVIVFLFLVGPLYAQNPTFNYHSVVDWSAGEVVINFETVFPPGSGSLRIRDSSEILFRNNFFRILIDSISNDKYGRIHFNSSSTMEERIQANPTILSHIDDIYNNIERMFNVHTRDMAGMNMQYKLNIFRNIGSYFITHRQPIRSERTILWTPSARYTGIVIYADDIYPVHGENRVSALQVALFPEIYDERMRRVLAKNMVRPAYLETWGTAGYFSDPNDPRIAQRVGDRPLYTRAVRLFGRYNTDIIIPTVDAEKIFYRGQNANLIAEGRFVIIRTLPSDTP